MAKAEALIAVLGFDHLAREQAVRWKHCVGLANGQITDRRSRSRPSRTLRAKATAGSSSLAGIAACHCRSCAVSTASDSPHAEPGMALPGVLAQQYTLAQFQIGIKFLSWSTLKNSNQQYPKHFEPGSSSDVRC